MTNYSFIIYGLFHLQCSLTTMLVLVMFNDSDSDRGIYGVMNIPKTWSHTHIVAFVITTK